MNQHSDQNIKFHCDTATVLHYIICSSFHFLVSPHGGTASKGILKAQELYVSLLDLMYSNSYKLLLFILNIFSQLVVIRNNPIYDHIQTYWTGTSLSVKMMWIICYCFHSHQISNWTPMGDFEALCWTELSTTVTSIKTPNERCSKHTLKMLSTLMVEQYLTMTFMMFFPFTSPICRFNSGSNGLRSSSSRCS